MLTMSRTAREMVAARLQKRGIYNHDTTTKPLLALFHSIARYCCFLTCVTHVILCLYLPLFMFLTAHNRSVAGSSPTGPTTNPPRLG